MEYDADKIWNKIWNESIQEKKRQKGTFMLI